MNRKLKRTNISGISLIVLVITIIVIIILAGAIILSLTNNNVIESANEAVFKNDIDTFMSELELYHNSKQLETTGKYNPTELNANSTSILYGQTQIEGSISTIISSMKGKYLDEFEVKGGKLVYKGADETKQSWAIDSGIMTTSKPPDVFIFTTDSMPVNQGELLRYTIAFKSGIGIDTINLEGKIEITDEETVRIENQPNIQIEGEIKTETEVDVTIAIDTSSLAEGNYKVKVLPGAVIDKNGVSNTMPTISIDTFEINNNIIDAPNISVDKAEYTNTNVVVTIAYADNSISRKYSIGSTDSWQEYIGPIEVSQNTRVYAKSLGASGIDGIISMIDITNIDKVAPTIIVQGGSTTTSSIAINITDSNDFESGINNSSYQYSKDNGETWTSPTSSTSYTFTALSSGAYNCIAKVADNAGNTTTSNIVTMTTQSLGTISMQVSQTNWTKSSILMTISYPSEVVTKQYSKDGGLTWYNYTSAISIAANGVILARGYDTGGNQTQQASMEITNIDKDVQDPTINLTIDGDTISGTITLVDSGSGININSSKYILTAALSVYDVDSGIWEWEGIKVDITQNPQNILEKRQSGIYYMQILSVDNLGNKKVTLSDPINVSTIGINPPELTTGMTAIKWNGSDWSTVANPNTDTTWYNYANKEWANARTADGSMWVWIPRYEYQISSPHSYSKQTIRVNFLKAKTTTATSNYTVHPAFTFGNTELKGIWVAKFEATAREGVGNSDALDNVLTKHVKVIPDVPSWRYISVSNQFDVCRNMETDNTYGWGTSGIGIDTHLMKNIEWGAIAYLVQSNYGKNSELWINPDSNYITGRAGTSVDAAATTSTNSYKTSNGVNASTTGNVYGIYDMSGGAMEFTASYINNGHDNLNANAYSLLHADNKYKDIYQVGTTDDNLSNYNLCSTRIGDAIYETSYYISDSITSWYSDKCYFPSTTSVIFQRGGNYSLGSGAGLFLFIRNIAGSGKFSSGISFRPMLAVDPSL